MLDYKKICLNSLVIEFWVLMLTLVFVACSSESGETKSVQVVESEMSSSSEDSTVTEPPKFSYVGGPIIFTEVDPINTVYDDHEGGDAGWVELYNSSSEPVNLKGMALTNSLDKPEKWIFGDVVLQPDSFMLVYLSGKNLPDFVAPHDSISLIGTGCWSWTDAQNDPPGESYSEPLDGQKKLCFTENNGRMFGARMRLGENEKLGWSSISSFVGTRSSGENDVLDISATNEILLHAFITRDRKVSFRLGQTGLDDWKGYELVFTGTGDSSTVYRALLPTGKTYPDLSIIYGTRMSPESQEKQEVTVKAFSYIARNRGHEPHTSFKIKNEGGSLYLMKNALEIMDSVAYPKLPVEKTWSLGDGRWGFADATPYGVTVSDVVSERSPALDTLTDLPPSGFYQDEFVVSFPKESMVRCEFGGAVPTENSQLVLALKVDNSAVVRCASFIPGALPGEVLNRTYLFETTPGVPTVFITSDPNSLFDPDTGIYMEGPNAEHAEPHYGANYWEDKEVPVFVELLEVGQGAPAFAKNAGLKIFGNYSRQNEKKSVAITFREKYGDKRLNYPLFPDFPDLTKFKVFLLRNNGSNFNNDYIRDRLASSISEGLGVDYQRGRGAIVYYNGEYYGIHNIRERSTEYYFETHYGYDPDEIDLLKADNAASAGSAIGYTDLMSWMEDHDLSLDENYAYVSEQIDVDNLMNYMQTEIFANNRDWPANNLKKWCCENPATKWKWFIYDTDFGFGGSSTDQSNIFDFTTTEEGKSWPNGPESTFLLRTLLKNQTFKIAFINRMTTLLSMNFESSRILARIESMMGEIESEISRDQDRWNHKSSYMSSQFDKIKSFAKTRQAVIVTELQEFFGLGEVAEVSLSVEGHGTILVHGLSLDRNSMTVKFFAGTPVTLAAAPVSGGVWAGWADGVMDATRTILPEEITSLTATFR